MNTLHERLMLHLRAYEGYSEYEAELMVSIMRVLVDEGENASDIINEFDLPHEYEPELYERRDQTLFIKTYLQQRK